MRKLVGAALLLLLCVIAGACANTPLPSRAAIVPAENEIVNPGDRVGHFSVVADNGEDVVHIGGMHCLFDRRTNTAFCEQPVGTKVNVGLNVYARSPSLGGKGLDDYWSGATHEMMIESRPVNLQAFGSVDADDPVVGTVRFWNVVVETDEPGTIRIRSAGTLGGDPFRYTTILQYTER